LILDLARIQTSSSSSAACQPHASSHPQGASAASTPSPLHAARSPDRVAAGSASSISSSNRCSSSCLSSSRTPAGVGTAAATVPPWAWGEEATTPTGNCAELL
jgi:hypothetical protein